MSILASCFGFGSRPRKTALPFRHDPPPADVGVAAGAVGGIPAPPPPPDGARRRCRRHPRRTWQCQPVRLYDARPDGPRWRGLCCCPRASRPLALPRRARRRWPRGEVTPLSIRRRLFPDGGGHWRRRQLARPLAGRRAVGGRGGGGGSAIFSDFGGGLGGGSVVSETRKRDNLRIPRSLRRGGSSRQQPRPAPFPTPPSYLNLGEGSPASEAALAALAPSPPSTTGTAADAAADASAFMKVQRWVREASQCTTLVTIAPTEPITNRDDYPGEDVPPPDAEEHRAAVPPQRR